MGLRVRDVMQKYSGECSNREYTPYKASQRTTIVVSDHHSDDARHPHKAVMDTGIFSLLAVFITVMLFMFQRTEKKRRRLALLLMLVFAELIRRYTWYRGVHVEAWGALATAAVLNSLFWLFIGRYNPVASSDEIKVMGLDD